MYRKCLFFLVCMLAISVHPVWAQDEAMLTVSGYYKGMKLVCRMVSGMCLLIGAVKAYHKVQSGDSSSYQSVYAWFSGMLISILIPTVLDGFFK